MTLLLSGQLYSGATLLGPIIAIFAVLLQYELLERRGATNGLAGLKSEIVRNKRKVNMLTVNISVIRATPGVWSQSDRLPRVDYFHFDNTAFINFELGGYLLRLDEDRRSNIEIFYHMVDVLNEYSEHIFKISSPINGDIESVKLDMIHSIAQLERYVDMFDRVFTDISKEEFLTPLIKAD